MGMFDKYHTFGQHSILRRLAADAASNFACPQDKTAIELYHESVITKLWGAFLTLQQLEDFQPMQVFRPGRGSEDVVRDRMTLSHHLDTFFVNLVSAIEISAQEINLYYGLGLSEEDVSVWKVRGELQNRRAQSPIETYYADLTVAPAGQWFLSLNDYRRGALHRKTTVKEVRGEFRRTDYMVSTTSDLIPISMRVVLPNNPLALPPAFDPTHEIEMVAFSKQSFLDVLDSLDYLFSIVVVDLHAGQQVPIQQTGSTAGRLTG